MKRLAFIMCTAILVAVLYRVVYWSLNNRFNIWILMRDPIDPHTPWWLLPYNSILIVFPLVPILLLALSMLFGVRFRMVGILLGLVIYLSSVFLAIVCIRITNHQGYSDAIHAIKTGFMAPFLVVGIGLPYVFKANRPESQPSHAPDGDNLVAGNARRFVAMKKLFPLFLIVVLLGCQGWLWLAKAKVPETWKTLRIGDTIDEARAKVPELEACEKIRDLEQSSHASRNVSRLGVRYHWWMFVIFDKNGQLSYVSVESSNYLADLLDSNFELSNKRMHQTPDGAGDP